MSISMDPGYSSIISSYKAQSASSSSASALEGKLGGDLSGATDEELMDVCKSFESYMLEQVMKRMKESIAPSEEDENDYIDMFGDTLYQQYAAQMTENGDIGLAQQLFEAMKRDYGVKTG